MPTIRIAAALLLRPDGHTLLVRKQGSSFFMQPGGKIEPGEAPLAALCRELEEELALHIAPESAFYLGRFSHQAANEAGHMVEAELFGLMLAASTKPEDIRPEAEIAEIAWVNPQAPGALKLAPLSRDYILKQSGRLASTIRAAKEGA